MQQKIKNRLVIIGSVLGGWYALCFIASFFIHTLSYPCDGTLIVGEGGIEKAICVNFNHLKQTADENHLGATGSRLSNNGNPYDRTGIIPQLRVQTQVCEARLQ